MSRTKTSFKMMIGSTIQQITIVVCGLILPPLIVSQYGSEINGIVSTTKQLLNYFAIVSLGIGAATQVALYKPLNDHDEKRINRILSATKNFYNHSGYLMSLLILVASIVLPLAVDTEVDPWVIFLIVLIMGIGTISEFIIVSKYKVVLQADQKLYVISRVQTEGTIINTVASVILIRLSAHIVAIQVVAMSVYLLRLFLLRRYVMQRYPYIRFDLEPDNEAIANRWQAFGYSISSMIINYTPSIIIAVMLGFSEASVYSVYNQIFLSMNMIVNVFSSGISSVFGNMIVSEKKGRFIQGFYSYKFVFRTMVFVVYTCAAILINSFIGIYMRNATDQNYLVENLGIAFVALGMFKVMRNPYTALVEATGKFKENNKLNIGEAIINISLSVIFVRIFGLIGILFGGIISSFLRSTLYMIFGYNNFLDGGFWREVLIIIVNMMLFILINSFYPDVVSHSFGDWIIQGVKIFGLSFIGFFVLNIAVDRSSFESSRNSIKNLLKRGK